MSIIEVNISEVQIDIRLIDIQSVEVLQRLVRQTFLETFAEVNSPENMRNYLDENLSIEMLSKELNNKASQFYIAFGEEKPVGYLKFNSGEAQTELKDERGLELERIYVLNEFQGQSIGFLLFEKVKEIFLNGQFDYLWLGVWEHNTKALNFYRKLGFIEFDKHIFKLGEDEQTDLMMKWQPFKP